MSIAVFREHNRRYDDGAISYEFIAGPLRTTIMASNMYDAARKAEAHFVALGDGEWVQRAENTFEWL